MDPAVAMIVRGALALLFAAAAAAKLRDRRAFHGIVLDYRLLPARLASRVADVLPWLEAALAAGLVAGLPVALAASAALLAAYAVAMGINLARGRRTLDCGCGGPPQRLAGWLLARNAVLAAAALAALAPAAGRAPSWIDAVTVAAGIGTAALLYHAVHALGAAAPPGGARVARP